MDGILVILFFLSVQSILLGILAQRKYHRIGVIWFFVAATLNVILITVLDTAIRSDPRWILDPIYRAQYHSPGHQIAFFLMVIIPSTVIVWIILATLPKQRARGREKDRTLFEAEGVIDGIPYRTHEDGTIDAMMPSGLVRFSSFEQFMAALNRFSGKEF